MQRRPPLLVGVGIRALVEQRGREFVMGVHHREYERARSVGERLVDVHARVDERTCGIDMSSADGKQIRRERSAGRALVDVRARFNQRADCGHIVFGRGPHQRGLSLALLSRVDVGTSRNQRLDRLRAAGTRRCHQRRLAVRKRTIGIGARGKQPLDNRGVPRRAGDGERRDAIPIRRCHLRTGANQEIDHLHIAVLHRPVQRRRAIGLWGIDVGALGHQRPHRRRVFPLRRVGNL